MSLISFSLDTSTNNATEGSSFSFIADVGSQDLNQPPSSFSFIVESVNVDENQDVLSSDNASGFEFLSAPGDIASDALMHDESQEHYAQSTQNMSSSFNFLNEHHDDYQSSGSYLHNTIVRCYSCCSAFSIKNNDDVIVFRIFSTGIATLGKCKRDLSEQYRRTAGTYFT